MPAWIIYKEHSQVDQSKFYSVKLKNGKVVQDAIPTSKGLYSVTGIIDPQTIHSIKPEEDIPDETKKLH